MRLPDRHYLFYRKPAIPFQPCNLGFIGSFHDCAGWHLGLLNTPLPFVGVDLGFDATSGAAAVVVSSLLVGASIGSLTAGQLADVLGPGRALLLNNLSLIIGAVLSLSTPAGFWGMLAGKNEFINQIMPATSSSCVNIRRTNGKACMLQAGSFLV